jgi:hypothetical protein
MVIVSRNGRVNRIPHAHENRCETGVLVIRSGAHRERDVPIPPDWEQMGLLARIGLARTTVVDRRTEIETVAQADEAIRAYLAGTTPPEKDKP